MRKQNFGKLVIGLWGEENPHPMKRQRYVNVASNKMRKANGDKDDRMKESSKDGRQMSGGLLEYVYDELWTNN
ncbi:hypothetical protein HPP92_021219 [Vanilla planifolia]|uniref:Uncharacterized protein n=1 Tax=Vanilla planifolia TaxID=51239 RepID=A0A835UIK2_VANPL|nr:hypothetical protein HPP92_021219 [Vanilla planifolia]